MNTEGGAPEAEFRTFYERSHLQVLSYCLRRAPDRDIALDAASDTYVVAWRRFEDLPRGSDGDRLVWLFAVARRVLANQRRSDERRSGMRRRFRMLRPDPEGSSPEREAVIREEHSRVLEAMQRLSENDRELLRLDTWEELPHRQLAQYFGTTENAIDVRLHRARKRLAQEYDRLERTHRGRRDDRTGGAS